MTTARRVKVRNGSRLKREGKNSSGREESSFIHLRSEICVASQCVSSYQCSPTSVVHVRTRRSMAG
jgi:hypothetical protein